MKNRFYIFLVLILSTFLLSLKIQGQEENICFTCHYQISGEYGDPAREWEQSLHRESNVSCVTCHGGNANESMRSSNFLGVPEPQMIPKLCGKCHSESLREYEKSVHAYALFQKGDAYAAKCSDCHNPHNPRKPEPTSVPTICSQCHSSIEELFSQGRHSYSLREQNSPSCTDCHESHQILDPIKADLYQGEKGCESCHEKSPETELGRFFKERVEEIEYKIDKVRNLYGVAEELGLEVESEVSKMEEAESHLEGARRLTHTLSKFEVEESIDKSRDAVEDAFSSLQEKIEDYKKREQRRLKLWGVFAFATILTILLMFYRKKRG
ncbi:MAG: cytochrome c3 family protein [Candidatus Methanofastidiosia archaeon]